MPKVSVIIPVYNVETYLRECLDSVVNQTLKDFEIICVDDGSTDNSLNILKEYAAKDDRFIIIEQKNQGAGAARNKGLEIAKGEYLSFLDSDDIFNSNMLSETYQNALENKSDIICFQYSNLNNITRTIGSPTGIFPPNPDNQKIQTFSTEEIQDKIFTISNPMPWNKLIRKNLVTNNNIKYQSLSHSNDIYFTMSCLAFANKITFIWESYVLYRYNRTDSLKNTRDDNPFCFYEAYKALYNTLIANNLFNKYKKSFLNSLISSTYWTYNHTEKRKSDVKTFAIKKIIPQFNLNKKENKQLLSKTNLEAIESVLRENEIIISLTSYPARIGTVNQAIESLLNQSIKADRVILWLAEEQFPNKEKDLPKQLLDLVPKGLTIDWCEDIKSYKKLIPTLKKYPDAIIVTADDDLIYDAQWLQTLLKSYKKDKKEVCCHRITRIYLKNKQLHVFPMFEYYNKKLNYHKLLCNASVYNKLSGGAGTLYPPHCFTDEIFNEKIYMKLAPTSDDIWFYIQALLNGYKVKVVKNNIYKLNYIPRTQENALCKINDLNDNKVFRQHINALYNHYYKQLHKQFEKENLANNIILNTIVFINNNLKDLFSVTNSPNKTHKIITILGIKIKISKENIENIFSVKNCDVHKIVTICGIKMSFKSKKLIERKQRQEICSQVQNLNNEIRYLKNQLSYQNRIHKYELCKYMSPEKYPEFLKDWYKRVTGETLNLDNPQTFNEKIQWLKLYDSTPLKTLLADKYLVRDWVKEKIGEKYLIPLLGVWNNFDEINFDELPNQFVLKCNHGCGYNIIVKDKSKFNKEDAIQKINNWMNEDFAFRYGMELHYSPINRKIVVEKYIENNGGDLYDYKFWCFNGKVEYIQFLSERNTDGLKMAFYDTMWNKQDFVYTYPFDTKIIEKPNNLEEMIHLAENLSKDFSHVRVDFYRLNDGTIYFGEMTFTSCSGACKWEPKTIDMQLGQLIELPINKKESLTC